MKVIGKRGDTQYLLVESTQRQSENVKARILDIKQNKLFPFDDIQIILKWGYWEEYVIPEDDLKKLLDKAEIVKE